MTLDIKLPDLTSESELPSPDIVCLSLLSHFVSSNSSHFQPFLPDSWDSSRARGDNSIRHDVDNEAPMRPILVVAGASSQQFVGGPTYEEHSSLTLEHSEAPKPTQSRRTGLWADILEDVGIPPDTNIVNPFKNLFG